MLGRHEHRRRLRNQPKHGQDRVSEGDGLGFGYEPSDREAPSRSCQSVEKFDLA